MQSIVKGGENGQESARNGLQELRGICKADDIVIIHDAVRPMVSMEIILDCIAKCRRYGIMRVQTPQAYLFGKVMDAHEKALEQNISDAVYTNILMLDLGETLCFSQGSEKNIKITTMEDVEIFKVLYRMKKEDWIK